jgi:glycosidase
MIKKLLSALLLTATLTVSAQVDKDPWTAPAWARNATIYEVNVRQYTKAGTFRAFESQLPRLKSMGVDILWLMPIYPIGKEGRKGKLGSYYAVRDYRAVNPEFGTMADLKHLVQVAHEKGMRVILDWVPNHSAPDNPLTKLHPDWYTHDSLGHIVPPVPDWSDVADFNYDNKGLREYQIESMKFWLREANVDGFRCDVAMMVPLDYWKQCRLALDKVKKVFMLAEAEGPEFHRNGFDMTYGWEYMGLCNKIAKGEKTVKDLYQYFTDHATKYKPTDNVMYFTSNHDENSWNGTEYERLGEGAKAYAVISATIPGMPLVYTGQESMLNRRLAFFEKDSIKWGDYPMTKFYSALLHLKQTNKALWVEDSTAALIPLTDDNKNVFAFVRSRGDKQVVTIVNLSDKAADVRYTNDALLGKYKDIFNTKELDLNKQLTLTIRPWGYNVLVK